MDLDHAHKLDALGVVYPMNLDADIDLWMKPSLLESCFHYFFFQPLLLSNCVNLTSEMVDLASHGNSYEYH